MKILHVLDLEGNKLFAGSKHDCKQFIRTNRIKRYRLRDAFIEKQVAAEKPAEEKKEVSFDDVFNGITD